MTQEAIETSAEQYHAAAALDDQRRVLAEEIRRAERAIDGYY